MISWDSPPAEKGLFCRGIEYAEAQGEMGGEK